jgi:hypothetical protein
MESKLGAAVERLLGAWARGGTLMVAARGLAAEIAKLLGRPENEGWVFVRCFEDAGIFSAGTGGRGSPWHGVFLFLAMASGAGPREAVRDAWRFGTLPFLELRRYDVHAQGESFVVEEPTSEAPETLAACLVSTINWHLLNPMADSVPVEAIRLGINGGMQFAEIFIRAVPTETDQGTPLVVMRYGAQLDAPSGGPYPVYRFAEISGAIFRDIAALFGSASSSGGIPVSDEAEDEIEVDDLPLAANPAEMREGV